MDTAKPVGLAELVPQPCRARATLVTMATRTKSNWGAPSHRGQAGVKRLRHAAPWAGHA